MTGRATTGRAGREGSSLLDAVEGQRLILCLGSGGVGKTTTSAALALALAGEGERVALLTIDPARRLADALGLHQGLGNEPSRIDLPQTSTSTTHKTRNRNKSKSKSKSKSKTKTQTGEVWAAMLDPAETFEAVIRAEAADAETAERILANRLFTNLTTSLSGTNEYMAAERLHQLTTDSRFDRVVVDTPPSRHMLDFLDSPGRLTRFVDHRLYRSVFAPRRGVLRPLNIGAQAIMRMLARLVGSNLVDDVVSFFADFEGLDQGFRRRADEIEQLLTGPEAAYLLVTAPRSDRLEEAEWILDNLARRELDVEAVLMNRVLAIDRDEATQAVELLRTTEPNPEQDPAGDPRPSTDVTAADAAVLIENLDQLLTLARQEQAVIGNFRDRLDPAGARPIFEIPEQPSPVADIDGLAELASVLTAP